MPLLLASLAFFVSGAAALVYQVSWQRLLALPTGIGIYSVAMIVASFMAGLGLGSRLGGSFSARVAPRRALWIFAALELAIGLFGIASVRVLYNGLYLHGAWLYGATWRAGLVHFASLLLPTTLMGMSLPFLVRGMVRSVRDASRTIGVLYGINTLGAAVGAAATPWLLFRYWGIAGATRAAALANLVAGLLALALAALASRGESAAKEQEATLVDRPQGRPQRFGAWLALYGLSGFIALALEVLWFRIADVALKATPFTFGTVLALYLVAYGTGSLAGAPLARRFKDPIQAFCLLQCAMLIVSGAAIVLLVSLPASASAMAWYMDYWRQLDGFSLGGEWDWRTVLRLYLVVPGFLYGVPTFLMGMSFPVLQRAVQDDPATSGRKVGHLQAANIAGCVAGSLLVGLVALEHYGTLGTLRGLLGLGALFAIVGWRAGARRRSALAGTALAVLCVGLPSAGALWPRLHGAAGQGRGMLIAEDATAVVAIVPRAGDRHALLVGGHGHSWIPFGGVHTRLGALPVLVHPRPADVAIVGLGSGDTAWGASCRADVRSVTVFEIARPEIALLGRLVAAEPGLRDSALAHLLADRRVNVRYADGRAALMHDGRLYDVIETDALKPSWAMSGNVYSEEYFRLCSRRLKPGGLMCTWLPSLRAIKAFRRAFPYAVKLERDGSYIGSNEPIALARESWMARVRGADVVANLGDDLASSIGRALLELQPAVGQLAGRGQANSDLFPLDEFMTPTEQ